MHLAARHLTAVSVLGTGLILAVSQAKAQAATFTLPFPAHVGKTTLLPGQYRMQLSGTVSPLPAIYLYRDGKLAATVPVFRQFTQDAGGSYLELVAVGGSHYLSKFISAGDGAVYTFGIPSAVRHQVLAETRSARVSVDDPAGN